MRVYGEGRKSFSYRTQRGQDEKEERFWLTHRNQLEGKEDKLLCGLVARKYEYHLHCVNELAEISSTVGAETHSSIFDHKFDRKHGYRLSKISLSAMSSFQESVRHRY